jgi:hypothetical protein
MPQDDIAGLLASQVCLPVLFAQAMAQAAEAANLIVTAGPDAGLTVRAAECGRVPAVAIPASLPAGGLGVGVRADADRATLTQAVAAMFAAGAITDLRPLLALSGPAGSAGAGAGAEADTLASRTVPRMRIAEQPASTSAPPAAPTEGAAGHGMGARTAVRSGY